MLATIGKGTGYFTVLRAGYSIPETYPAQAVYVKPSPNSTTNFSVVLVTGQTILNDVPYSQLTNADTTAAFTSAADFQTYFQTNFFRKAGGSSGITPSAPINYNSTTGALSINQSSTNTDGYLSQGDWNIFNNKASTNAPNFTGNATATTQATADNSTRLATTAYVQANFTATSINFVSGLFVGSVNPTTPTPGSSGNALTLGAGSVSIANISATGTPASTNVLYGNGTWAVPFDFTIAHTYTGVQTHSVTNTASSLNTNYGQVHTNVINQTSTAGFTDVLINRVGAVPGSGSQLFVDFQIGGTSKFSVSSTGQIQSSAGFNGGSIVSGSYNQTVSTSTNMVFLTNYAPADATHQSLYSPDMVFNYPVWNTSGTPAQNFINWKMVGQSVGGAAPTYSMNWYGSLQPTNTPSYGTAKMSLDGSANLSLLNSVSTKHLIGSSTAPTIAAGTGAGTTPTVSIVGSDIAGTITVTTGTSPASANAVIATITFNSAYTAAPRVIITESNTNAQGLVGGSTKVICPASGQTNGVTTTTFALQGGSSALTASTTYLWTYQVIQ